MGDLLARTQDSAVFTQDPQCPPGHPVDGKSVCSELLKLVIQAVLCFRSVGKAVLPNQASDKVSKASSEGALGVALSAGRWDLGYRGGGQSRVGTGDRKQASFLTPLTS